MRPEGEAERPHCHAGCTAVSCPVSTGAESSFVRKVVHLVPLARCMTFSHSPGKDPLDRQRLAQPLGFAMTISAALIRLRSAEIFERLSVDENSTLARTRGVVVSPEFSRCNSAQSCEIADLARAVSIAAPLGPLDNAACAAINQKAGPMFELHQEYLPGPCCNAHRGRASASVWLRFMRELHGSLERHGLYACDVTHGNVRFDAQGRPKLFDATFHEEAELTDAVPLVHGSVPTLRLSLPTAAQTASLARTPALSAFHTALLNLSSDPRGDPLLAHSCSKILSPDLPRIRSSYHWLSFRGGRVQHWGEPPEIDHAWPAGDGISVSKEGRLKRL